MKKPYENHSNYDPGRFRFQLAFYEQQSVSNPGGGSLPTWVLVQSTKGIKDKIYEGSTLAQEISASVMNGDCTFVIRYRKSWHPAKDMNILCDGFVYTIKGIQDLDVPVNYWKLLCVKSEESPDIFATT